MKNWLGCGCAALFLSACAGTIKQPSGLTASGLDPQKFESVINGKQTCLLRLTNANGMEVCITNFGGRVVSILVPDRNGKLQDVVLGFDSVGAYRPEVNPSDFGAAIGRYANRIQKARFVLDGDTVKLPVNNFGHCLHGGPSGWQYQVYEVGDATSRSVQLVMHSPDGDNGFPGNVTARVTYTLTDDNALDIRYEATTDRKTVINMTNHSYFNLSGDPNNPVTEDLLTVHADSYTPVDSTYMTTGEILPVEGTPMDFRTPKAVGQDVNRFEFEQLKNAGGYDHNWVLNAKGDVSQLAATLICPKSGIRLDVYTDEPGIQVYSGNFLDGTQTGKKGIVYRQRAGICLETQHYPDSPNKPEWPPVVLEPGRTYSSHCIYRFSTEK